MKGPGKGDGGATDEGCFGRAVAAALLARHPFNTSGHIAQRIRCTKKTAENILAGHLSSKTITRLIAAYGWGLMIDATAAVTGQSLSQFLHARAESEARAAEAALERAQRWSHLERLVKGRAA